MKTDIKEILTDEKIDQVFGSLNFGIEKRLVISEGLLKVATGVYSSHTTDQVLRDLKLVTPRYRKLTKLGRDYLYYSYKQTNL